MTTLATDVIVPAAISATVQDDSLIVDLDDGRSIRAPITWYPRLLHATLPERQKLRLIARGQGIHWPDLDEDISIESIVRGKPSTESAASLKRWLAARGVTN